MLVSGRVECLPILDSKATCMNLAGTMRRLIRNG
jgi:hypothetical protein